MAIVSTTATATAGTVAATPSDARNTGMQTPWADLQTFVTDANAALAEHASLVDKVHGWSLDTNSAAVTNTTDETIFDDGADDIVVTIPANTIQVGSRILIEASGYVADNNSTDTLTIAIYMGDSTGTLGTDSLKLATSAAVDVADNDGWHIRGYLVCQTVGAASTATFGAFVGQVALGTPGTAAYTITASLPTSTVISTTGAEDVFVTADWSVAHADNQAHLSSLSVQVLNPA